MVRKILGIITDICIAAAALFLVVCVFVVLAFTLQRLELVCP